MVVAVETIDGFARAYSDSPSKTQPLFVQDAVDADEANDAIRAEIPATIDTMDLEEVMLIEEVPRPNGNFDYRALARYREPDNGTVTIGEGTLGTFDTTGATAKITQSKATIASYAPPSETAPDSQGAINDDGEKINGTEVIIPTFKFTAKKFLNDASVDQLLMILLAGLTGTVNDDTFQGFAAGEVLFLGVTANELRSGNYEIVYNFAQSDNITGETIGTITGIDKKGWEYLWIRYRKSADAPSKSLANVPQAVYVEKVYNEADFDLLDLGDIF